MSDIDTNFKSDRYSLQREIGKGTWGTVYWAKDSLTDQDVAIKLLTPTELAQDQMKNRPVKIAVVGLGVVFEFQTYLNQSPAVSVPQGTYTFQVLISGTSTVVLTVPNVPLTGKSYTVVAEGLVQAGSLQAALFQQA